MELSDHNYVNLWTNRARCAYFIILGELIHKFVETKISGQNIYTEVYLQNMVLGTKCQFSNVGCHLAVCQAKMALR